ncbi:MAG: pilus assembly protein TadG-related protein, partial [Geminicoccaceae bacterium]
MQRLNLISINKTERPRQLKAIAAAERGSVAPILAMVMLVATAGAALAVDMARAYALKSDLQAAADSAALAAAVMLPDTAAARKAAARAVS